MDERDERNSPKVRPFSCSQCNAAFTRVAHLRRHQASHRADKPFFCTYCPVSSSRKDVIVRHTRKFHTNTNHRPKERDAQRAVRSHEPSICDTNSRLECYPLIQAQTQDTADLVQNSIAHGIPGSDFISPPALSNIDFLADEIPMLQGIGLHNDLVLESFGLERLDRSCTGTPSTEDRLISVCHNGFHSMLDQIGKDYRGGSRFLRSHDRPKTTDYQFTLTDEDYAMTQKNLTSILSSQKSLDVWFPSKYTMMRFVRAFFDHMAPHMPIVHQPTFNIASVEPPLLIETMACGALYLSENEKAVRLHRSVVQMILEDQLLSLSDEKTVSFKLWVLQTSLLINVFRVCTSPSLIEEQRMSLFPHTIQFAHHALREMKSSPPDTYKQWVYEETMRFVHRLPRAIFSITTREDGFVPHFRDLTFFLPSDSAQWEASESDWLGPPLTRPDYVATLNDILAAQKPYFSMNDFSLLTIMSSVMCRICSLENMATQQLDVYNYFVRQMEQPLQVLNEIWKDHTAAITNSSFLYSPLLQCAHGVLSSAYYHLYGSHQLRLMRRYLYFPESLKSLSDLKTAVEHCCVEKPLSVAAESWRQDCRVGIGYLQKLAPLQYSPLAAICILERAVLIFWYLSARPLTQLTAEQDLTLRKLLLEGIDELSGSHSVKLEELVTLPLTTYAQLLNENIVWQWPSTIGEMIMRLAQHIKSLTARERPEIRVDVIQNPNSVSDEDIS